MSSNEIKKKIEKLKSQGTMEFVDGINEKEIIQFESENKITLPTKYKKWLEYSDGGDLFLPVGVQLYGVSHKPIISIHDEDCPNEKYIVIGALGTGDPVLCEKNGGESISIYNREADRIESDEIYKDFYDFIDDLYDLLGIGE